MSEKLSPETVADLQAVAAHMLAHPEQVDMTTYWEFGSGCIIGHLFNMNDLEDPDMLGALEKLGIPWATAIRIEFYELTSTHVASEFKIGTPEYAQEVVRQLNAFIEKWR